MFVLHMCSLDGLGGLSARGVQAEEFEVVVGEEFRNSPASPIWYPGSKERYEKFLIEHRGYELVEPTVPDGLTYSACPPPPSHPTLAAARLCSPGCAQVRLEEEVNLKRNMQARRCCRMHSSG